MVDFKPFGVATTSMRATSALAGHTVRTAVSAKDKVSAAAVGGLGVAAIPVRGGIKAIFGELPVSISSRNCWRGEERAWIEVRGLDRPDGADLARAVIEAVSAQPGVRSARVNRPLSRVVVGLSEDRPSLRELCRLIEEAEKRYRLLNGDGSPPGCRSDQPGTAAGRRSIIGDTGGDSKRRRRRTSRIACG